METRVYTFLTLILCASLDSRTNFLFPMWCPSLVIIQVYKAGSTNRKVAGSIPDGVSGFFIEIKSFWSHYGTGVDSASNRNEYREYFLGVKAASAWCWQTHYHPVPLSRNLGTLTSWNPLGPSRPVTGLVYLYLYKVDLAQNRPGNCYEEEGNFWYWVSSSGQFLKHYTDNCWE